VRVNGTRRLLEYQVDRQRLFAQCDQHLSRNVETSMELSTSPRPGDGGKSKKRILNRDLMTAHLGLF
jgi:hypothetical protein